MKLIFVVIFAALIFNLKAQSSIQGNLNDDDGNPVLFANVAIYKSSDSSLVKVEISNENGAFRILNIKEGNYFLKATFVGLPDFEKTNIQLGQNENKALKTLTFAPKSLALKEVNITAKREMVVVKPDRTVFNVQGTINSVGSDAISLLRQAPAVNVDNNDNISVLGREGVLVYVDGKRLPLDGDDLSNYLKNLTADQIDRIEIITNPGARYEAEGNAGIIDIRLKKDKNLGANGSINSTYTKGTYARYNTNLSGNYRSKKFNLFGNVGYNANKTFNDINFINYQNGLFLDEINNTVNDQKGYNYRFGTDFFLHKNHTIGFLVGGVISDGDNTNLNRIFISEQQNIANIDSILVAENTSVFDQKQNTYNLNYRFLNKKGVAVNIDLDYGNYDNNNQRYQPNIYFNTAGDTISQSISSFDTPIDIDIYTGKIDFEKAIGKGKIELGTKLSRVETKNTFEVSDVENGISIINDTLSNRFNYTENVYAGYVSYSRPLSKKVNLYAGIRAEQTDATGNLIANLASLQEPPVDLNYLNWFPSAGLTWSIRPKQTFSLNYGRRINRPDYNVLNPFRNQLSEISIETGNPFLNPEIVNNYELGYTLNYKYNFKIAYSRTDNKITRLIGPDDDENADIRASSISWDNLTTTEVFSFNASLPMEITKWWNVFSNLSASYLDNQADYGDGAIVDVQTFTYTIFQQHSFYLPYDIKGEISGYYSGPGVWGGVFKYDANWSLGLGLQRAFFKKKLNVRVKADNIFNRIGWQGTSTFNGLTSEGNGRWDNRFVSISLSYSFGNQNVKSRKRKTGIESESKRVGQ